MNGVPNGVGSQGQVDKDGNSQGGGGMYEIQRPFVLPDVELPPIMYTVSPINKVTVSSVSNSTHDLLTGSKSRGTLTGNSTSGQTDPTDVSEDAMNKLEKKQLNIIEQLKGLQTVIDGIHQRSFSKIETKTESESTSNVNPKTSLATGSGGQLYTNENIDIVIHANPNNAPYSLMFFVNLYEQCYHNAVVSVKSHVHSSFKGTINMDALSIFNQEKNGANFRFTLIWKNVDSCTMIITPVQSTYILGESNMARFLSRLLPNTSTSLNYDCLNWENLSRVDTLLELATKDNVISVVEKELKTGNNKTFLTGKNATIADLVLYSSVAAKLVKGQKNAAPSVKNWFKFIEITFGFHNSV